MASELSINEKYSQTLRSMEELLNLGLRQDSPEFQKRLLACVVSLLQIRTQVNVLGFFSDNEGIEEVNTKYIKFMAVEYHLAELLVKKLDFQGKSLDFNLKTKNLEKSQDFMSGFLKTLKNYGLLNKSQLAKYEAYTNFFAHETEVLPLLDPASRREDKIANFKLEKQINEKINYFEKRYPKFISGEDDEDSVDDEALRELYIEKLRLYSIKAFTHLEMTSMELQVLKNRPAQIEEVKEAPKVDEFGYTERVEFKQGKGLLSKEGKVLQPFTIVSKRDELKEKVFGYGQYLPTMTVEEYIEEEIKRGGIKTETVTGEEKSDSDSDDDDDEKIYEKRKWDDFKDYHFKGEGNMKGRG